jgi:hypothetical protein
MRQVIEQSQKTVRRQKNGLNVAEKRRIRRAEFQKTVQNAILALDAECFARQQAVHRIHRQPREIVRPQRRSDGQPLHRRIAQQPAKQRHRFIRRNAAVGENAPKRGEGSSDSAVGDRELSGARIHRELLPDQPRESRCFCQTVLDLPAVGDKRKCIARQRSVKDGKCPEGIFRRGVLPSGEFRDLRSKCSETELSVQQRQSANAFAGYFDRLLIEWGEKVSEEGERNA